MLRELYTGNLSEDVIKSRIVEQVDEARFRRITQSTLEGLLVGVFPKETGKDKHVLRVGRIPEQLWPAGERLEPRFGKLGKEYKQVVFDKRFLTEDPTLEWITPGHSLFEPVREEFLAAALPDHERGAVSFDA